MSDSVKRYSIEQLLDKKHNTKHDIDISTFVETTPRPSTSHNLRDKSTSPKKKPTHTF